MSTFRRKLFNETIPKPSEAHESFARFISQDVQKLLKPEDFRLCEMLGFVGEFWW